MLIKKEITLDYNRVIWLELLDARSLKVTTNCAYIRSTVNENRNITELNFVDEYKIKLDDLIEFVIDSEYKLIFNFYTKQIKQFDDYYILYSHTRTKSSYFLFPMLGYNREWYKWNQFFINSYTFCPEYDRKGNFIYLLYKYMPLKQYNELERAQINANTFVEILYPSNKGEVVFVHSVRDEYKSDLSYFKEGKYSLLSNTLKRKILFFHGTDKESEIGQILFKDEKRRKQLEMEFNCKIPVELDLLDIPGEEEILLLN